MSDTTPQDGDTLTATTGDWINGPTAFAYQWQSASNSGGPWTDILNATNASYTVSGCQQFLRVKVTATNGDGTGVQESLATSAVTCVAPSGGSANIAGTQQVGNTLTGSATGTWSGSGPITYTYAWFISTDPTCTSYSPTPYATGETYALPESTPPWNRCIKLVVTGTGPSGLTGTAEAFTDNIDGIAPSFSVDPVASGVRRIGEQLFVLSNGTVDPGYPDFSGSAAVDYTYIWEKKCQGRTDTNFPDGWIPYSSTNRNPANITQNTNTPNQTGTTYTLQPYASVSSGSPNFYELNYNFPGDIGCDVRVEVKATNGNNVTRTNPVSVGNNAAENSNARGRIQRTFGNTYEVETATSFEDGASAGHWGQAPNLTDPTKPINDCLGPAIWNDPLEPATAPYVPTATPTANAQEACRQLQQAVDQNKSQTINLTGTPVNNASFAAPAQSQQNGFTKIKLGPSNDGDVGGEFTRGALIQDFKNLLIEGNGEDGDSTTITGSSSAGANTADLCDYASEDSRMAIICVEDTDGFGQDTNVSVRDLRIDGNDASQNPADLNQIYSAIGYQNASGAVQNVQMFGFNGPSTIGNTGAGGRAIDIYRYADTEGSCSNPERFVTGESEFDELSGPQAVGINIEGEGCDLSPYSNTNNTVIARVQDGSFGSDDPIQGEAIIATEDAKLLATDNEFDDGGDVNIKLGQDSFGNEAGPNPGSVIRDNDIDGDMGPPGVWAVDQVQPDMADTVDAAQPVVIKGNEIYRTFNGISVTDGTFEVNGNEVRDTYLGVAVGPVGFGEGFGFDSCNNAGPYNPDSVDDCDQTEVDLNGNDITDFFVGVASTNDGIPGATDLSMEGNRVVSGYQGYEPYPMSGGGVSPQAGQYNEAIGLVNYYDPEWNPYEQGGDPPAANQQVDPVDARNNWWGCNSGPTYNPDESDEQDLNNEGYCNPEPSEGNSTQGEVIIDGDGVGGTGDENDQVQFSPYLDVEADAGDKLLRAQASEVTVPQGPIGETAQFFMDLSENNSGEQKSVGLPPVEIQYEIPTGGTFPFGSGPFVTDAVLDRTGVDTNINTAIAPNYLTAGYQTGDLPVATRTDYQILAGVDDPEDGAEYSDDLAFEVIQPDPSLFSGDGPPPEGIGQPGDFWFDTEKLCLYGPKAAPAPPTRNGSAWPSTCRSLAGGTVLSGSGAPSNSAGNPGDFYLDTSAEPPCLYGPRGATSWPSKCIPVNGYPLVTADRLKSVIRVQRAQQNLSLVRVNCPSGQIRCEIRATRANFQARQNPQGVVVNGRASRTVIPAGQSAIVRAKIPGSIFRRLTTRRSGSVTVSIRAVGAQVNVELDRRISLRR